MSGAPPFVYGRSGRAVQNDKQGYPVKAFKFPSLGRRSASRGKAIFLHFSIICSNSTTPYSVLTDAVAIVARLFRQSPLESKHGRKLRTGFLLV